MIFRLNENEERDVSSLFESSLKRDGRITIGKRMDEEKMLFSN